MPIPGANLPAVILLCEIDLQCKVILRAGEYLRAAAARWIAFENGAEEISSAPPIEIIKECNTCLSAAASISRMLIVGERRGPRSSLVEPRCAVLMNLLGHPGLNTIASLAVRNSWEHLDERLDEVLISRSYQSYEEIRVAAIPLDQKTFINRHFDPVKFEVRHGPDSVALEPLIRDCQELLERIDEAWKLLRTEIHDPYPAKGDADAA